MGEKMNKICVYTCICGGYDKLIEQSIRDSNADFYCFSDREIESKHWNIISIQKYTSLCDYTLVNRFFKWNPHLVLPQYKYSVYIDGNLEIISFSFWKRIYELINSNCKISIAKHNIRKSVYDEARICIKYRKDNPENIKKYLAYLNKCTNFKNDKLLYQNGLIFREHMDADIVEFDTQLYGNIINFTKRDQLILPYIRQKLDINIVDFNYGKSYPLSENRFFGVLNMEHRQENSEIFKNEMLFSILTSKKFKALNRIAKIKEKIAFIPKKLNLVHKDVLKNIYFSHSMCKTKRNIIFLYDYHFSNTASTILRVFQLVDMLRYNLKSYNIFATPSLRNIRNSLVVITKSALQTISEYDLSLLVKNNNMLVYDPIDSDISENKIQYSDIIFASSHSQFDNYTNKYTNKKICYLTHNVDRRISNLTHHHSKAMFAYFGELENTIISNNIKKYVDFISINTKKRNKDFIQILKGYNIHYAMRYDNGYIKPFTKGFIAAHSKSNIIIQRNTYDVGNYLPDDYPFLVNSTNENDIIDKIVFAKQEYNTSIWMYGLQCMEYIKNMTSPEKISSEFKDILRQIEY